MENEPASAATASDPLEVVLRYHRETKHHFRRYARALGYMDWVNQPNPFRRYEGSPVVPLPIMKRDDAPRSPRYEDLYRPGVIASVPVDIRSLSRFFECSLSITAWKQAGDARWALRANPSSGNLHPTEGYALIGAVAGLSPVPGLYHYAAKEHALELRAEWSREHFESLLHGFPPHAFLVGFSSVNWRETWKYGERAFRYCQHDVGHAIGGARLAAQTLGWRLLLLDGAADDTVAALLGVNRTEDFIGAEREHPDCLVVIWPADPAGGVATAHTNTLPRFVTMDAVGESTRTTWHGKASRLSRKDPVQWPLLNQVEVAAWKPSTELSTARKIVERSHAIADASASASHIYPGDPGAAQVIRQRRSALAFDGKTSIPGDSFFTMLSRVMPRTDLDLCQRPLPWDMLPWEAAVHLALFVHRVDGLAPGLYVLARDPAKVSALRTAMRTHFAWTSPPGCPDDLPLFLLDEGDARQLAVQVSCHQDIAGDSAFSLGMLAEYESSLQRYGPWFYRRLFWETGVIGQVLYLEAEASGMRATGIGCFFDDPVHKVFGLNDMAFQSLYHFTIGSQVDDPRLTTLPPYELDH